MSKLLEYAITWGVACLLFALMWGPSGRMHGVGYHDPALQGWGILALLRGG